MTRIRPQSLSGLLSAALLLIVVPLVAAIVYGGFQLRELSRTSDVLMRDSLTLTQHTQRLYQHIVAMERSAVSQQLRVLRHLGLVIGERRGRRVVYALYDSHVADLLDQAVFHIEHVRLGYAERIREAS